MNPMRPEYLAAIERLLDNFDWERVLCVMKALGWKYGSDGHPPTYNEMRKLAKELLGRAVCSEEHPYSSTSGGLKAESHCPGHIALYCVVESAEEDFSCLL